MSWCVLRSSERQLFVRTHQLSGIAVRPALSRASAGWRIHVTNFIQNNVPGERLQQTIFWLIAPVKALLMTNGRSQQIAFKPRSSDRRRLVGTRPCLSAIRQGRPFPYGFTLNQDGREVPKILRATDSRRRILVDSPRTGRGGIAPHDSLLPARGERIGYFPRLFEKFQKHG